MLQRRRSWSDSRRRRRRLTTRGLISVAIAVAIALPLWYVIARTTLVDALAPIDPDLALWLSPDHPDALVAKAEALRQGYLAQISNVGAPVAQPRASSSSREQPPVSPVSALRDLEAQRSEIRTLAKRAIQHDPLNAQAYRLIGEMAPNTEEARSAMIAAVARSRHETIAVYWLLNDSFLRRDWAGTIRQADTLLRTRPQLAAQAYSYLAVLAAKDDARGGLVAFLSRPENADARSAFLKVLPRLAPVPRLPLTIMQELAAANVVPSVDEVAPYIQHLLNQGLAQLARTACRALLKSACGDSDTAVTNPNFETVPSGLPFDWQLGANGRGAIAEVTRRPDGKGEALHLTSGPGRSKLPPITQTLTLPPGPYTLGVAFTGMLRAKRGLIWQLDCLYGKRRTLMRTDMLFRETSWREITATFEVPADDDCRAQVLRLVHDARSASEELIEGDAWFDDVKVVRRSEAIQ